jgi:hypothetical protein
VKVKVSADGKETTLEAEQALVAIGFRPNSKGLGLEEVGVKISERGFVEINEKMQTSVPNIYAIGDVTGKLMLAHVGSAMGIIAAENIAGAETITLDYEMMPRATYCHPQVASFGLTEAQAKERGYNIKIGRFPFQPNGKALGLGDYAGFVKIVVDEKYGEILGAHMIGPEVTELLPELTLAHMMELTPHEIARNVHAHPTLSEVLMEAAHGAELNCLSKPGTPIGKIQEYDFWRYWKYVLVMLAGLTVLVGLHLVIEGHNLRPFAIPLLFVSLIQLGLIVFRYVFIGSAHPLYIFGDLFFLFGMSAFSALMLAHVGLLEPLRKRFTNYFDRNSTSIRTHD